MEKIIIDELYFCKQFRNLLLKIDGVYYKPIGCKKIMDIKSMDGLVRVDRYNKNPKLVEAELKNSNMMARNRRNLYSAIMHMPLRKVNGSDAECRLANSNFILNPEWEKEK